MEGRADDLTGPARDADETALSDGEKLDWLRLIRTENVGPITFRELISHFGSAAAALDAIPDLRRRGGMQRPGRACLASVAERELKAAKKAGARMLALPDADYPPLLRHISAPPPLLYAKGDLELAARNIVAIVGSRNASAAGRQFAGMLARDLGRSGIVIASGLARGIDTAAHQAALPTGTIAALAGGIDSIYPPENAQLHEAIGTTGLLLTEAPPGFAPQGPGFPTPQPHHFWPVVGCRDRRGGTEIRLTDHGADGVGAGPRGLRRAGTSARPARQWHKRAHPKRRTSGDLRRRHYR